MAGNEYEDLDQQFEDIQAVLGKEMGKPHIQIKLHDLKDVYDKIQHKKQPSSEQRIAQGKVNGVAWTTCQVEKIMASVQRTPEAAQKVSKRLLIEPEELKVDIVKYEVDAVHFMIDLDSVYKTSNGDLVYALDKNDVEERNIWQLVIIVNLIDGYMATFKTQGFRIRTKPKPAKPEQATGTSGVPFHASKRKRQESGTSCSSGATASPPLYTPESLPYSGTNGSPPDGSTTQAEGKIVTDHLEAQRALIKDLTVFDMKTMVTRNADIAYHVKLTESARRRPDLEEGDVIAFLTNAETGQTEIEKLSYENSPRALMAGVISRSAYLYAHAPRSDVEKGTTETVCVIGLVKVKVMGTVQNGERVYVALDKPGVAVPETQIPLRPMADRTPTLLGQALETKRSYVQDKVHLVQCFVSIVLGIQSGQIATAIDNLQERMQGKFEDVMIEDRSRWLKGLKWKLLLLLIIAAVLTVILYMFLAPGTWFQHLMCEKGSIKGHTAYFEFVSQDHQYPKVHGIEFTWEKLTEKLNIHDCEQYNATGMHYYLNLPRCEYFEKIVLDHKPQIRGPELFAVDANCSKVYYVECDIHKWTQYKSAVNIKCHPPPN